MITKICNKCRIKYLFTLKYFYKELGNKSGLRGDCKFCNAKRVKDNYIPKMRIIPKGFKSLPYSNKHYVSKNGEVWSYKLGRLLRPHKHKKYGYLQLSINGRCKKVHQ